MVQYTSRLFILASLTLFACKAYSIEISWGGYLNAIGSVSNSSTPYLESEIDDRGSFSDTNFGLNLGTQLNDNLQLAAQLSSGHEHNNIELDWAFVNFSLTESLNLSAGQLKYPGNLISEYINIGYLYPWIRPPQEIYSHNESSAAMTLEAFTGSRLLYHNFSGDYEYELQLYAGATEEKIMNHDKMLGLVATLSSGRTRILLGYNRANMEMKTIPTAPMNNRYMSVLSLGAHTEWQNFVIYTEFVQSTTEGVPLLDTTASYVTLGYNFGQTLLHITHSVLEQDSGIGQTSNTLGLRHELTTSSAIKMEWQRAEPDAPTATGIVAIPMIAGQSGLFSSIPAESKINIYSVSINVYF